MQTNLDSERDANVLKELFVTGFDGLKSNRPLVRIIFFRDFAVTDNNPSNDNGNINSHTKIRYIFFSCNNTPQFASV